MYTITLSNGTKLDNLTLNGNNFISDKIIEDAVFDENLKRVEISDGENTTTYEDMFLASNRVDGGKSWIVLLEKTDEMKRQEQNEEEKTLLKAQIKALSDRNDFLEDCVAEMASIVYA